MPALTPLRSWLLARVNKSTAQSLRPRLLPATKPPKPAPLVCVAGKALNAPTMTSSTLAPWARLAQEASAPTLLAPQAQIAQMATAKISALIRMARHRSSASLALPTVIAQARHLCALLPPWWTIRLMLKLLTSLDSATLPLATPPMSPTPKPQEPLPRASVRHCPPSPVLITWPSNATPRPTLANPPAALLMLRVSPILATLVLASTPCALLAQSLPLVTLLPLPSDATPPSRPAPSMVPALACAYLLPAILTPLAPLAFAKSALPVTPPECALPAQMRLIARITFSTPLPLLKLERATMAPAPTHRIARSTATAVCPSSA